MGGRSPAASRKEPACSHPGCSQGSPFWTLRDSQLTTERHGVCGDLSVQLHPAGLQSHCQAPSRALWLLEGTQAPCQPHQQAALLPHKLAWPCGPRGQGGSRCKVSLSLEVPWLGPLGRGVPGPLEPAPGWRHLVQRGPEATQGAEGWPHEPLKTPEQDQESGR